MPRRGGGGRSSAGFSRPAPAPRSSVPAHPPPQQPAPMMQQPKQPGLFANMASTAAGVAVGSAVGHTIGAAMTGGMGGGHAEAAPAPAQAPQQYQQPEQQQNDYPCQMELKQFLECSQNQSDISLCYGFNEALKECRMRTGQQQL